MIKVGVTGNIASGKTTFTNFFNHKKNTFIFNADKESKKHLKKHSVLQQKLVNSFGKRIVGLLVTINSPPFSQFDCQFASARQIIKKCMSNLELKKRTILALLLFYPLKLASPTIFLYFYQHNCRYLF